MKRWLIAVWGMLGLAGVGQASENPFDLKPNMQHLEKDVNDLIGELKSVKIENDDDLDDELDDDIDEEEETDVSAPLPVSNVSEKEEKKEETVRETNDHVAEVPSQKPEVVETKAKKVAKTASSQSKQEETKTSTQKQEEVVGLEALLEEPPAQLPDEKDAMPKHDQKEAQEKNTPASSDVKTASVSAKPKSVETRQTEVQHTELKKEHAPIAQKPKKTDTAAKKKQHTSHVASSEKKPAGETVTIASIMQQPESDASKTQEADDGIADIDLEKERQEAARRAEEELRRAIALVDQED